VIRLKKRKTNENIEEEIKISKRWIRSFTELYALLFFKANPDSSGYDICKFVESEYGFKISYSRIYPLLNELERKGIISVKEEVSKYPPKLRRGCTGSLPGESRRSISTGTFS